MADDELEQNNNFQTIIDVYPNVGIRPWQTPSEEKFKNVKIMTLFWYLAFSIYGTKSWKQKDRNRRRDPETLGYIEKMGHVRGNYRFYIPGTDNYNRTYCRNFSYSLQFRRKSAGNSWINYAYNCPSSYYNIFLPCPFLIPFFQTHFTRDTNF